jgi:hypothetical protein
MYFASPSFPQKCPKIKYWDCSTYAYDPNYIQELAKTEIEKEEILSMNINLIINSNKMKKLFDGILLPRNNMMHNKDNIDIRNMEKRLGKAICVFIIFRFYIKHLCLL